MNNNESQHKDLPIMKGRPVLFGEVLFDSFPDNSVVMGGAPLNVAWHLKGFGLDPLLISRVGRDALGEQLRARMQSWGLDDTGIQADASYPTGRVEVTLTNGQPSFAILPDQAYDFIASDAVEELLGQHEIALLYYGSLAVRNSESLATLRSLQNKNYPRFVDINLRAPWYDGRAVANLLIGADWVKLNDDEFIEISTAEITPQNVDDYRQQHEIENLILTLGDKGAHIYSASETISGVPVMVDNVVDTVGAGDAFSSIMLLGILSGWTVAETVPRALAFAAYLCSVRGATISDIKVYESFKTQWSVS